MEVRYENMPSNQELIDFIGEASTDLGIDAEEIIVYPANNDGGVYTGRDGNSLVIGLGNESKYIVAHELGHDRYYQGLDKGFLEADPKFNDDGQIIVANSVDRNDDLETVIDEVFAENVARSFVEENEIFTRNPLGRVKPHLNAFDDFTSTESIGGVSSMLEENGGRSYFESPEGIREYDVLRREIGEFWNEDRENFADIIYNTWEDRIHPCYVQGREDVIWDTIEDYADTDYSDTIWHQINQEFAEEIRETIEEDFVWIMKDIRSRLLAKRTRMQIGHGIPPQSNLEEIATSNPSHFSARIQSGEVDNMKTDYNHSVGNYLGSQLFNLGVTFEDLLENNEALEEISQRGLDLAMEMGKNPEHYSREDYNKGIKFLAEDTGLIN